MNLRGFQFHVALLVFAIVLAGGLFGQYYLRQSKVIAPLAAQIQELPGVEQLEVLSSNQGTVIEMSLSKDIALSETMTAVWHILAERPGQFQIRLVDTATDKQISAYNEMQFVIEEAVMVGNFQEMAAELQAIADGYNLEAKLGIDREYVYVQLEDGSHTLYRMIYRDQEVLREVNRG